MIKILATSICIFKWHKIKLNGSAKVTSGLTLNNTRWHSFELLNFSIVSNQWKHDMTWKDFVDPLSREITEVKVLQQYWPTDSRDPISNWWNSDSECYPPWNATRIDWSCAVASSCCKLPCRCNAIGCVRLPVDPVSDGSMVSGPGTRAGRCVLRFLLKFLQLVNWYRCDQLILFLCRWLVL